MASWASLFLCGCALLLAEGSRAASAAGLPWAVQGKLPGTVSHEGSPSPQVGAEHARPAVARRELVARLREAKTPSPVPGAVQQDDAAVLLQALAEWRKDRGDGFIVIDDKKLLSTWDVKRPCAQWYGITCDRVTLRVTAIKLPGIPSSESFSGFSFQLVGPFPAELGSLPELRSLNLAMFFATRDVLPSDWLLLKNLSSLDLSSSAGILGGEGLVPEGLCQLRSLTYLNLNNAIITSPLPKQLTQLQRLAWLDFTANYLEAVDFRLLGRLRSLRSLILQVSATLDPTGLSTLKGLKRLDLSLSLIKTEALPSLSALTSLLDLRLKSILDVSGRPIQLSLPWLGSLSKLVTLDLSGSGLNGGVPEGLSVMTSLKSLYLSWNRLSGTVPQFLWTLSTLTTLDLTQNRFTGVAFSTQQSNAAKLKKVLLRNNMLQGPIPEGWSTLSSLTFLSVSGNSLTGSIPSGLGALAKLKSLYLNSNRLTGSLPSSLFQLGRVLHLSKNQLSGPLPQSALSLIAQRVKADVEGAPLPGFVDLSWNYLSGPCYDPSVLPLRCGEPCNTPNLDLAGLVMNCLQGCDKYPPEGMGVSPYQRSNAECKGRA